VTRSSSQIDPTSLPRQSAPPGAPDAAVLSISSLSKRWPRQERPVLHDIDLELRPGELVWLTGENGAGKTTLLRIVAGIVAPDSGTVRVCGMDVQSSRRAYQRRLGLLTAGNSGLYARMTVRQHFAYWARLALVPAGQRGELVQESIERFELAALADRRLDRMSMGQRQRVRIAMTFLHRPALVLLDEPLNSLDDEGCDVLAGAVEGHQQRGGSTVWCSPGRDGPAKHIDRSLRLVSGGLHSAE